MWYNLLMRVFLAVEIPDNIKNNLKPLLQKLKRSGGHIKWVEPENLHITLKFFGEVNDNVLNKIKETLSSSITGENSFSIELEKTGQFPERARIPKVLWVGAKRNIKLSTLVKKLEKKLSKIGFPEEKREFIAHLTIGRVKSSNGFSGVRKTLEEFKNKEFGSFIVKKIVLFKSTLTPSGPSYEKLEEYPLK